MLPECGRTRRCRRHLLLRATCIRHNLCLPSFEHFGELSRQSSGHQSAEGRSCAMPRTPPSLSGSVSATQRAPIDTLATSAGLAWTTVQHTSNNNSVVSTSSRRTLKCSYVQPSGPGEDPRAALLKLVKNALRSNGTGRSGSKFRTSSGTGLETTCGRLS